MDAMKDKWVSFINQLQDGPDPMVASLFSAAKVIGYDNEKKKLTLEFPHTLHLFVDLVEDKGAPWYKQLQVLYGEEINIETVFTGKALY